MLISSLLPCFAAALSPILLVCIIIKAHIFKQNKIYASSIPDFFVYIKKEGKVTASKTVLFPPSGWQIRYDSSASVGYSLGTVVDKIGGCDISKFV